MTDLSEDCCWNVRRDLCPGRSCTCGCHEQVNDGFMNVDKEVAKTREIIIQYDNILIALSHLPEQTSRRRAIYSQLRRDEQDKLRGLIAQAQRFVKEG